MSKHLQKKRRPFGDPRLGNTTRQEKVYVAYMEDITPVDGLVQCDEAFSVTPQISDKHFDVNTCVTNNVVADIEPNRTLESTKASEPSKTEIKEAECEGLMSYSDELMGEIENRKVILARQERQIVANKQMIVEQTRRIYENSGVIQQYIKRIEQYMAAYSDYIQHYTSVYNHNTSLIQQQAEQIYTAQEEIGRQEKMQHYQRMRIEKNETRIRELEARINTYYYQIMNQEQILYQQQQAMFSQLSPEMMQLFYTMMPQDTSPIESTQLE